MMHPIIQVFLHCQRNIFKTALSKKLTLTFYRITNLQSASKQTPLVQPPQRTTAVQGAVQMRIKSSQNSGDRLSQSKSMVLQDADVPQKPVCRP